VTPSPVDVDAQVERAETLCELRRFEEAISLLNSTLASFPDSVEAWAQLCIAHLDNDQPADALQAAIRAANLAPDAGVPQLLLSAALRRLGRTDEALLAARRAVNAEPDNWSCQLQLGIALLSARKVRQARLVAARVAAMAPHEPMSHLLLGDVARARRRYAEAEAHVRRALALDPASASTLSHLGLVELRRFGPLNPARLAHSAGRVADALRADARDTTIRDRLDSLLAQFLYVESTLVWLVCGVLRALSQNGSPAARAFPVALLAVPMIIGARTVRALPPAVRARLGTVLRERPIAAAVALETLAIAAVLCAAAAPTGLRHGAVGTASGAAIGAVLLIVRQRRRIHSRIARRPLQLMSNGVLRLATGACWLLALTCIAFAENRGSGSIAAVGFVVVGFAINRSRRRRP
jgi:tetratricopeptide (TPR) repeat protein